mgnify:CR=1 FL=1
MNVVIIGASGYSGAELASLVAKHPTLSLTGCYVSAHTSNGLLLASTSGCRSPWKLYADVQSELAKRHWGK